jgi:TolB-like protein/Flp pilus assembly protein TadD
MASVWGELKRRNVVRVAIAYAVVAWLLLQVADVVLGNIGAPAWLFQAILLVLVIGFPVALIFAWAFELTPEGLKKEKHVDRSQSISPVTDRRLDFIIIGVLVVALALFSIERFVLLPARTPAIDAANEIAVTDVQQSIAVLPFVNMSSDPEQEYFSDGLSEEILNLLAKIPNVKVIARTSSFAFKGENDDVRVIGQTLGVKTVLEGSVRKSGNQIRITAQLIDVSDGAHIWSETYDRTMTDIFAIQDDVAAAIIGALQIHVGVNPTRGRPTENTEAYTLFLKARALLADNKWVAAEAPLQRAIELDPNFAEAYELLARIYWSDLEQQQALDAAARALAIDPDLVLAQAVYQAANIGSHLAGIEAFEQALRKQPHDPLLMQSLVWNYEQAGYFREALNVAHRMVEVDPLSAHANSNFAGSLTFIGHTNEAEAAWEVYRQVSGNDTFWNKGVDRLLAQQDEQAIAHFEAELQQNSNLDTSWVRELVTNARDPVTGQAYLDRRIPEIIAAMPEDVVIGVHPPQRVLHRWYVFFGFLDRYFEILLENDPNDSRWALADFYLFDGVAVTRRTGFTAHPKFLEVADTMGIIKIWEKRGPPDFCDKVGGEWVCE